MYNSHEALKNLYEVSRKELDYLVNDSKKYKEVLGSRMMGGGFGGCTINFIREDFIEKLPIIHASGMTSYTTWVYGLPSETQEDRDETRRFIDLLKPTNLFSSFISKLLSPTFWIAYLLSSIL